MDIYIKNMVCDRCIRSVAKIMDEAGHSPEVIKLGLVQLAEPLSAAAESLVRAALLKEGFEWLDDQRVKWVERIKSLVVELVHYGELDELQQNLSAYLGSKLHKEYHYLSGVFSSVENTTIEQYFILQKIERVKEWLIYDEMTLSEMSFRLGYSSVAHLSGQFRKVTGFTPSAFKKLKDHHRRPLDQVNDPHPK